MVNPVPVRTIGDRNCSYLPNGIGDVLFLF